MKGQELFLAAFARDSYAAHLGYNCYLDHGGVPLFQNDLPLETDTADECMALCSRTSGCWGTVHTATQTGSCWLRSSVNLSECDTGTGYDTYTLTPPAPAPTPLPTSAPTPQPAPQPAPQPTPDVVSSDVLICNPQCDQLPSEQWATSPSTLAQQIGNFSVLPGATASAPVLERWEASPPVFAGSPVYLQEIADFARELLESDPFGTGDSMPYVNFYPGSPGQAVAITQRQLAFIVVNTLMGNTVRGGTGLHKALLNCKDQSIVISMMSLLAVLSRELSSGGHGSLLVGSSPRPASDEWKDRLSNRTLSAPNLVNMVGSTPYTDWDFMTGGIAFQALTDIAGSVVGGGGRLCGLANTQDESLVQFYSEVLAFAFFTSEYIYTPWTLLGARRYVSIINGESVQVCGEIEWNWINEEMETRTTSLSIGGRNMTVHASSFVAVASSLGIGSCTIAEAIGNNCDAQRRHLDADVSQWYQAFEPTMYPPHVQGAFRSVVQRVGTGPWGSGVWYGDSQMYFLTMWLASALADAGPLDYYVYDHFCENAGNQCYVLGESCASCLAQSGTTVDPSRCGSRGVEDMIQQLDGLSAAQLYSKLANVGSPPTQVFDLV